MNIVEAIDHPDLFAPHFPGNSWSAWRAFLRVLFGLPVPESDLAVIERCLGGLHFRKGKPFREAWLICGRRSGKSIILALIAVYLAAFVEWSKRVRSGENPVCLVLAADRKQARVIFRYIRGLLFETPALRELVEAETQETITLTNGVLIEVATCSYRAVRGRSIAVALCDEIAFWRDENAANPDVEVVRALRPALATLAPDSMLLCASSPHGRAGALYDAFKTHYGQQSDVLVWRSPTTVMNPSLDPSLIQRDLEADPEAARAEWLAEFRDAITGYVAGNVLDAAIIDGRERLPFDESHRYYCFVDPSGGGTGKNADSFCAAVAHRVDDVLILDAILEIEPPVNPSHAVLQTGLLARSFGLTEVTGDAYGARWVSDEFEKIGIEYRRSKQRASDLYRNLLPALNSGRVELLDHRTMRRQFLALQRRVSPGAGERIVHPPNGHDDIANAVAGALVLAADPIANTVAIVAPISVGGGRSLFREVRSVASMASLGNEGIDL